jgi:dTDP-4-dehydrorhamnose reductase
MVMGSRGMLGREVVTWASEPRAEHARVWSGNSLGGLSQNADISDREWVAKALDAFKPGVVINCAGAHGSFGHPMPTPERMISSNAIGPLVLAEECGKRGINLIHVSTDCVFSGHLALGLRHNTFQTPDPMDLYGRSKLLGEPEGDHVTVVRTSFIGVDHGLMAWFLQPLHEGAFADGWANSMWSGSTVDEVARRLVAMVDDPPGGLVHLATEKPISKWEVLVYLKQLWPGADRITVNRVDSPRINRALIPNVEPLPHIESALARYRLEIASE